MKLFVASLLLLAVVCTVNGDGHMFQCSACFTYWFKQGQDVATPFGKAFLQGIQDEFAKYGGNNTQCMMAGGNFNSVPCETHCVMGYHTEHFEYQGDTIEFKSFSRWCASKNNTGIEPGCVYDSDFYRMSGEQAARSFGGSFRLSDVHLCYCKDKDNCNNMMMPDRPKANGAGVVTYSPLVATLLAVMYGFFM